MVILGNKEKEKEDEIKKKSIEEDKIYQMKKNYQIKMLIKYHLKMKKKMKKFQRKKKRIKKMMKKKLEERKKRKVLKNQKIQISINQQNLQMY